MNIIKLQNCSDGLYATINNKKTYRVEVQFDSMTAALIWFEKNFPGFVVAIIYGPNSKGFVREVNND